MMCQNIILANGQFNVGVDERKRERKGREEEREWREKESERERVKAWTLCFSCSVHQADEMQLRADTLDVLLGLMTFNATLQYKYLFRLL